MPDLRKMPHLGHTAPIASVIGCIVMTAVVVEVVMAVVVVVVAMVVVDDVGCTMVDE